MTIKSIVIVGAGHAAFQCAVSLRELGFAGGRVADHMTGQRLMKGLDRPRPEDVEAPGFELKRYEAGQKITVTPTSVRATSTV